MRSSGIDAEIQDTKDINTLITEQKEWLAGSIENSQSPLYECLDDFLAKTNNLHSSFSTAGATLETIYKDLISVNNVILNATSQHIEELFLRWNSHTNAYKIRRNTGGVGTAGGICLAITAGALFYASAPISVPILATAGAIGLGMGIVSTGVVVEAKRKRTTVAECLHDILSCTYNSLLDNGHYSIFASARLAIIELIAQSKSINEKRDMSIETAIDLITNNKNLNNPNFIIEKLSELQTNLTSIFPNSATAKLVDDLKFEIYQYRMNRLNNSKTSVQQDTSPRKK